MSLSIAQRVMLVGLLVLALALVLAIILTPEAAAAPPGQGLCTHVKNCTFLGCQGLVCQYSCTEYDLCPCTYNGWSASCVVNGTYKTYTENRLKFGVRGPKGNHTLTWK